MATLNVVKDNADDYCEEYHLRFDHRPTDAEKGKRFDKMLAALGCKDHRLAADDIDELEDIVDQAVSLAPRSRSL